jgi:spore germination cell wall hydrolase CwlJ-like protein
MTQHPAQMWRDHPRETLALAALGLVASLAFASAAYMHEQAPAEALTENAAKAPPVAPPLLVRKIAPEDALGINSAIPLSSGPNPAAAPFRFVAASASRDRALECLTSAVYYEAGNEPVDGQRAVAQVVLNRVRHPAFPSNVCGVVYQGSTRSTGCQFTFTCDGSLLRPPSLEGWAKARKVAEAALSGAVYAPVGYATHYHANYVVPYWASSLAKNAIVGAHIFYRWAGGWGRSPAFSKAYAGVEPDVRSLRTAALAAEAAASAMAGPTVQDPLKVDDAKDLAVMNSLYANGKPGPGARVVVRFDPAARKAVEEAPRREYVDKFKASDNLRWSLGGGAVKEDQKALGKADVPAPPSSTVASAAGASAP